MEDVLNVFRVLSLIYPLEDALFLTVKLKMGLSAWNASETLLLILMINVSLMILTVRVTDLINV